MRISRRSLMLAGGSLATLPALGAVASGPGPIHEIAMIGDSRGARVWFDPAGLRLQPGDRVRWTNRDKGNAHTATAYHPGNFDRARRVPPGAMPWDSDFLLPEESFEWVFSVPGVYDYYCVPHEHAGMVGRIVVDGPSSASWTGQDDAAGDLPEGVLSAFPPVADILKKGNVRRVSRNIGGKG